MRAWFLTPLLIICLSLVDTTFAATVGQTCTDEGQYCNDGSFCSGGKCGGEAAYCQPNVNNPSNPGTGSSSQCASGFTCRRNQCTSGTLKTLGQTCTVDYNCVYPSYCSDGQCGGANAFCNTPEGDGLGSAPTYCKSGLNCVNYRCDPTRIRQVGQTCTNTDICDGSSTCSGGKCGGEGASCSPNDGSSTGTGASSQCASGSSCLRYQCSTKTPQALGGSCTVDYVCPENVYCSSGKCGGTGAFCNTPEGDGVGPAPTQCTSGLFCVNYRCDPTRVRQVGQTCTSSDVCDGYSSCSGGKCGGEGAYCYTDDGTGNGPSSRCATGFSCLRYQCTTKTAQPLGGTCTVDYECQGDNVYCSNGKCGGEGAFCSADENGDPTGIATKTCATNLDCINYRCSTLRVKQPGETCTTSEQCDDNSSCGTDDKCGGEGAYCQPDQNDGSGTGPSTQCAPNKSCLRYQCSGLDTKQLGDACTIDNECPQNTYCSSGICGGVDAFCTADGGGNDGTGPATETCASGLDCINYRCSTTQVKQPGESCSSNEQCDQNSSCGTDNICGGDGASCQPDPYDPSGNGPSTQCAPNKNCLRFQCSSLSPKDLGDTCTIDNECPQDTYCNAGKCGGVGAYCVADDPDNGGTGPATQRCAPGLDCISYQCSETQSKGKGEACTQTQECRNNRGCSGGVCGGEGASCQTDDPLTYPDGTGPSDYCTTDRLCLRYQCSSKPIRQIGETCDIDAQCPTNVYCTGGICGGAGAFCTGPDNSNTGPSAACASGECKDYQCTMAPSSKPVPRGLQKAWDSRCRPGEIACPVLSGRGVECIDPKTNVESCGGCMFGTNAVGADCTAIEGVDVVNCILGACFIDTCLEGFYIGADNRTCVTQTE